MSAITKQTEYSVNETLRRPAPPPAPSGRGHLDLLQTTSEMGLQWERVFSSSPRAYRISSSVHILQLPSFCLSRYVNIGHEFQAELPPCAPTADGAARWPTDEESPREQLLWKPRPDLEDSANLQDQG